MKSGMSGGQKPHRLLRLRNASTRWRSVAVMNPLHAGDAYVSRDTTTARKTACRPISVMPWWRSNCRAEKNFFVKIQGLLEPVVLNLSFRVCSKMQKMWWFGVVRGHSRSTAMSPFDRAHTTSYSTLIETMCLKDDISVTDIKISKIT